MKLLRHGPKGQEKPALLHTDGTVRDLSPVLADLGPAQLSPAGLAALRALEPTALPALPAGLRFLTLPGLDALLDFPPDMARVAAKLIAGQLLDTALLSAGLVEDPRSVVSRLNKVLELALEK